MGAPGTGPGASDQGVPVNDAELRALDVRAANEYAERCREDAEDSDEDDDQVGPSASALGPTSGPNVSPPTGMTPTCHPHLTSVHPLCDTLIHTGTDSHPGQRTEQIVGHDTYQTGGFNPGNTQPDPGPLTPDGEPLRAFTVEPLTPSMWRANGIMLQREAQRLIDRDAALTTTEAYEQAAQNLTRPKPGTVGVVSAADVARYLPASAMALRAAGESGWHRVSRAVRSGFLATCGAGITLAECGAVDAWADIHDEGTSYCHECIALDAGEWTQARYPNGDAEAYVIAARAHEWASAAHRLRTQHGKYGQGHEA